jgi:hypothetical protein
MNAVAAIPLDDALRAMVQSASGPEDALEWWNLIRAAHHGEGVRWLGRNDGGSERSEVRDGQMKRWRLVPTRGKTQRGRVMP